MRRTRMARRVRSALAPVGAALLATLPLLSPTPGFCEEPADFLLARPRYSIGIRGGYAINEMPE